MQKKLNATTRAFVKVFRIGENGGGRNGERTMDAFSSESCVVPPVTVNPKDHKPVNPGEDPPGRPVCDASSCINGRLSDALCEVLVPVSQGGGRLFSGQLLHALQWCGQ